VARRHTAEVRTGEDHDDVVRWYERKLQEPAVVPWAGTEYVPVTLGPTWAQAGGRFVLPEQSLGWDVLGWCGTELQHGRDQPWRFTLEQARFVLWWYAVGEDGRWLFRDGVLQRLKGWGKDPLGACLLYAEALGPCRFAGWGSDGRPIPTDCPDAWVQTAATALEQTKNTMRLMPGLLSPAAQQFYRVQLGKEVIHALGDSRLIQAVTSSPSTLEGARATCVLKNETQHWLRNNDGHEMAAVIDRNATKSPDGAARTLAITNAYDPGADSSAQHDREAWEQAEAGQSLTTGILYDSVEAPPDAPLSEEAAPHVVAAVRGDSVWLSPERVVQSILDTRNPPSRSRRFWYNQITASEDAWLTAQEWQARAAPMSEVKRQSVITLGFDGSRRRARGVADATALVGCRVSDGHVFTLEVWEQPEGPAGETWEVPTTVVDAAVHEAFRLYKVVGFYCDPAKWESWVSGWEAKYRSRLKVKASQAHPCEWWMTGGRAGMIARAVERFESAVKDSELTHDGGYVLTRHVLNARRKPTTSGMHIAKEHPDSPRKIDAAYAAILAWTARLDALAAGVGVKTDSFTPRRVY
jgi:hypothetical protein